MTTIDKIKELFASFSKDEITGIDKLPQAGSERHYYRIYTATKNFVATYGANIKENESFIYFTEHFKKKNLATPQLFCVNAEKDSYIQEDFGDASLLNKLEELGYVTNRVMTLNSKHFDIPQNRERVFMLSSLVNLNEDKLIELENKKIITKKTS